MVARPDGVRVHSTGLCESSEVGPGTRIWAFAHVMEGARIGADCNLGDHTFVESGAWIGDRVTVKNGVSIWDGVHIEDEAFIGPAVVFTNDRHPRSPRMRLAQVTRRYAQRERWLVATRVCRGASIGAGAIVLPGVTLGAYCMVGAGTVVTRDVPAHRIITGRRPDGAGWVCACGTPLTPAAASRWTCPCGSAYREEEGPRLRAVTAPG
jgi:acetyltransferase-like isoleucine patch superfamily enzyme